MMDEPWKLMGSLKPFHGRRLGWSGLERARGLTDYATGSGNWTRQGELKRIPEAVSPRLEMAEIADRAAKLGKGWAKAGGRPAALVASPAV